MIRPWAMRRLLDYGRCRCGSSVPRRPGGTVKLIVVDDHELVREAVQHVLARLEAATTVVTAPSCDTGFALADAHPDADLVLLDLNLPGLSGIAALRAWRTRYPALPVVVVSANQDRQTVLAALSSGAAGFVPKSATNDVLLAAVRMVLAGGKYFPPEAIAAGSPPGGRRPPIPLLTPRQLDVLRLLAQGKSNKVICRELGISERTVKVHLTDMFRVLGVQTRTQAALAAARLGLIEARSPD